jgi:hypothetical protein
MEFETHLRKTSDNPNFPWKSKLCPFIRIKASGEVKQGKTIEQKVELLAGSDKGDLLLAAWPGQWSQDIFVVDDWAEAKTMLLIGGDK